MLTQLKKIVVVMAVFATVLTQASTAGALSISGSTGSSSSSSNSASTVNSDQYCGIYGCGTTGTGSTGSTGSSTGVANPVSDPCAVYGVGCQTGNGSTGNSSGVANPVNDPCAVYGVGCSTGNANANGGASSANTVNASQYCDIYGCTTTGTGSNGTGSTGNANANGGTSSANTVNASQYCDIYGCTTTNNGSTGNGSNGTGSAGANANGGTSSANTVNASQYCDIYGCTTTNNGSNGTGSTGNANGSTSSANLVNNPCDVYSPCTKEIPNTYPSQPGTSQCNNHKYPSDIDGHWAEIYIRRLYDLCILEGYQDGTFRPQQNVTRAELVKMALYAAGIQANPGCYDADCGSPFMDLDLWQGSWVRAAWDRHIVQGYNATTFAPNQSITRAEATKVILAAYGYGPLSTGTSFFNDVSGWSTGWIEQAHDMGIVSGIGNGNFDPNRPITRAEAAKIIAKTIEKWDTRIVN